MPTPWRSRLLSPVQDLPAPLVIAMCVNAFGAGLFYPFALLYYTRVTSLDVGAVGLILTTATLLTLAISPITGFLVDRFGAQKLVVSSQILEALGFLLLLTVSSASSLFLAAMLVSGATRMFYASFSNLVSEVAEPGMRDRAYGLVGVTQSLASSLAGVIAGVLISGAGSEGFRIIVVGNALCLAISGFSLARLRRASPQSGTDNVEVSSGYRAILVDGVFLRFLCANVCFVMCSMLPGLGSVVHFVDALGLDPAIAGGIGLLQTAMVVTLQMKVLDLASGRNRWRMMTLAGVLWMGSCLGFGAVYLLKGQAILIPAIVIVMGGYALAQLLYIPIARAMAVTLAQPGLGGRYVATFEFSWGLAAALGPALFGVLFSIGPAAPWVAMVVPVAIATLIVGALAKTESFASGA